MSICTGNYRYWNGWGIETKLLYIGVKGYPKWLSFFLLFHEALICFSTSIQGRELRPKVHTSCFYSSYAYFIIQCIYTLLFSYSCWFNFSLILFYFFMVCLILFCNILFLFVSILTSISVTNVNWNTKTK